MSGPVPAPRHRALHELYLYWDAKRAGRFAPPRSAIDPAEIRGLLPVILLLDVMGSPPRFRVRLAGTGVVEAYGSEITGRYIDQLDLDRIDHVVLANLAEVVNEGRPSLAWRDYIRRDERRMKYERLVLPLSSDGETVDKLLGGVVFELAFDRTGRRVNRATSP